ncbi:MAG: hypothetical protein Kow006_14140 [Gammaproteobacteria bacterium]
MDPLTLPLSVMEAAWNAVLRARPELQEQARALDGRVVEIELEGLERRFFVVIDLGEIRLQSEWHDEPDTRLRGTPMALASLGAGEHAALFRGEVTIEGDAELGRAFRELLDAIARHWEAPLAGVVGEESATRIRHAVDEFVAWGAQTLNVFARDFAGYLKEEAGMLADKEAVVRFLDEVDTLRNDVDRLRARVKRLRERLGQ